MLWYFMIHYSKRSKGRTTQLQIEGTCHCCYIMRPSFRQFFCFHGKYFFNFFKTYISWRDQLVSGHPLLASFLFLNSHWFVSRTVPTCFEALSNVSSQREVAKLSQYWESFRWRCRPSRRCGAKTCTFKIRIAVLQTVGQRTETISFTSSSRSRFGRVRRSRVKSSCMPHQAASHWRWVHT